MLRNKWVWTATEVFYWQTVKKNNNKEKKWHFECVCMPDLNVHENSGSHLVWSLVHQADRWERQAHGCDVWTDLSTEQHCDSGNPVSPYKIWLTWVSLSYYRELEEVNLTSSCVKMRDEFWGFCPELRLSGSLQAALPHRWRWFQVIFLWKDAQIKNVNSRPTCSSAYTTGVLFVET